MFNGVTLPAGILQHPMLGTDLPEVVNYARIGSVIGHEIFHGFDARNHGFARDGTLSKMPWTRKEKTRITKGLGCIKDSYKNLEVHGERNSRFKIQPAWVQSEVFADIHGLQAAYGAWKALKPYGIQRTMLPGFEEFTPEQLFWILHSSIWCASESPEVADALGVHPPLEFRTWKGVQEIAGWHEAFSCPKKKPSCTMFGKDS